MDKIETPAILENLEKMIDFVVTFAEKEGFQKETLGQIRLACEEALVNVINYAYPGKEGMFAVLCDTAGDGKISIEIADTGIPFDPLSLPAPDTSLPIEQRKIGGLGIFMVRKIMNEVHYRRDNGYNILTLIKHK